MRRWLWLALLVATPLAVGQEDVQSEACREPILALQQPPRAFGPGTSMSLLMWIQSPNAAPVESVRASVTTTAPAGWTAIPAQRELTLAPTDGSLTALAVTAPNRGSGTAGGNITILVTFVCTSGAIQTSASAAETMPVELEPFAAPWPLVLGAFVVLAIGVAILGIRRLRRGVALIAHGGEKEIAPGKSVKFTFAVENRRGKPQRLRVVPSGLPEGWAIHLALDAVDLEPGEEKTLWAILKAPPHAQHGTPVAITLRLDGSAGPETSTATLHARVAVP